MNRGITRGYVVPWLVAVAISGLLLTLGVWNGAYPSPDPCPVIEEADPPIAVVFYYNPNSNFGPNAEDPTVPVIVSYPPAVRYALWADGLFIWSRNHASRRSGPEYLVGHVSQDAVSRFYSNVYRAQQGMDRVRFAAAFPPDSARIVTAIAGNDWCVYMGSRHESIDGSKGVIATDGGTRRMMPGETAESVAAGWSPTYREFRTLWSQIQDEFAELVKQASVDRTESAEIFRKGSVDFASHPAVPLLPHFDDAGTSPTLKK